MISVRCRLLLEVEVGATRNQIERANALALEGFYSTFCNEDGIRTLGTRGHGRNRTLRRRQNRDSAALALGRHGNRRNLFGVCKEKGVPGMNPSTCTVGRVDSAGDTHELGRLTADGVDDPVDGSGHRESLDMYCVPEHARRPNEFGRSRRQCPNQLAPCVSDWNSAPRAS